ncbi:Phosphatidylglycerol/phosphatidylinositol transfer protein [Sticta canariensis]|nr:Phosphatidylglycerol/phosphatidylinositol transfer protein [Sticta canariensis]
MLSLLASTLAICQASVLPKHHIQQQHPVILEPPAESQSDLRIPGDSPIRHCADPVDNIFTIDRIDLHPNPPLRGGYVSVDITGTFEKEIGDEPKFMLNATYGSIHSIDTVENLCDHVDIVQNQALNCPPAKGKAVMTTTFFINELMIPPGNYTQRVDVYTKDKERIMCVFAAVTLT